MIAKVDVAENLEFAKATMRVEATEVQVDGSITPDEYYFSFAGDPHEVAEAVQESANRARQLLLEEGRSSSNTPQDLASTAIQDGGKQIKQSTSSKAYAYPGSMTPERQESSNASPAEDLPSRMHIGSQSMTSDDFTYPPDTSELPEPRVVTNAQDSPWATWIRKQPRKVLAVPAKIPFVGRLPLTHWSHTGKRVSGSGKARDSSSEEEADAIDEMDIVSQEKEFLKSTFGLGDREEVVYREFMMSSG